MKTSSLTHLTAVSGANCAIVVGLVMIGGGALGISRTARVTTSAVVLLLFVVVVTPQPSVQRAAVMSFLVLAAIGRGIPLRGPPVLCLATIGLLVMDPWLAREYGFALSVLATGGLLLLAPRVAAALGRWLPAWLAAVIAVPFAAQVACQPVLLLLDSSLPTYGVIANLLAAPAAPLATVVGLGACLLASVAPPIAWLLACLAWLPASWIAGVANAFAGMPGARIPWPPGVAGVLLAVALTVLALVATFSARARRPAAIVLAASLVVIGGVGAGLRAAVLLDRPSNWQIAGCDVGQGDAFLVRSAERVALIDTGPDPVLLRACLDELGIGRIHLLVLTHFDLDHVGGAEAVRGGSTACLRDPPVSRRTTCWSPASRRQAPRWNVRQRETRECSVSCGGASCGPRFAERSNRAMTRASQWSSSRSGSVVPGACRRCSSVTWGRRLRIVCWRPRGPHPSTS